MNRGGGVGVVVAPRSGLLGHCQGRAGGRLAMEALRRLGSCLRRNDGGGAGMGGGGAGVEEGRGTVEGEWRGRSGVVRLVESACGLPPPT